MVNAQADARPTRFIARIDGRDCKASHAGISSGHHNSSTSGTRLHRYDCKPTHGGEVLTVGIDGEYACWKWPQTVNLLRKLCGFESLLPNQQHGTSPPMDQGHLVDRWRRCSLTYRPSLCQRHQCRRHAQIARVFYRLRMSHGPGLFALRTLGFLLHTARAARLIPEPLLRLTGCRSQFSGADHEAVIYEVLRILR